MTDEQRAELKRLAEAATSGPWSSMGEFDTQHVVRAGKQMVCNTLHGNDEVNALYIAAANPVAVLDLLREHEEDQGVVAVWRGRTERAEAQTERLLGEVDELRDRLKGQVDATYEQTCRAKAAESERDALKAENERLRLITEDFCNEVDRTAQWREAKGMKPATDTIEVCSDSPYVLINLKRWARRFGEAMKETP